MQRTKGLLGVNLNFVRGTTRCKAGRSAKTLFVLETRFGSAKSTGIILR